ncbi:LUD domain-containing protein [Capnocytophaga sp. G2]|uniref:LUD domain-containing protein n=1 Tax=Capnocytophaga sp. G2 TaxID=3110695 RepID=UPI002B4969C8|nr:LUD domain-containing protein [Capnocytophaga sp. G2]MEB3005340.1 LUD domain-containing protein [Capnocytophaga sp. G2]
MKWLEKLFKGTPKGQEMSSGRKEKYSKLPIDEAFVMNFKEKGGIFLYIDSIEELEEVFQKILLENNANATIFTHNEDLEELFYSQYPSYFTGDSQQATLFLTDCEYLVADEGSVLFSSRQLGQKRLDELPPSLIIIAKTSQIVGSLIDAMGGLNRKTHRDRPNNIRSLRSFTKPKEKDSIFYENCYRTTYLLLLEDLNPNE